MSRFQMGLVIAPGLAIGTLFTLFVVPAVYMVIAGDLSQIDLPVGARSGLRDALDTLEGLPGIGVCRFDKRDVVRHPLVARIVDAYDQRAAAEKDTRREARSREVSDK